MELTFYKSFIKENCVYFRIYSPLDTCSDFFRGCKVIFTSAILPITGAFIYALLHMEQVFVNYSYVYI